MVNITISFLQNIGMYVPSYMSSCPRRQYPSHSCQTKST